MLPPTLHSDRSKRIDINFFDKWEMKAHICPIVKKILLLSLLFWHFINTAASSLPLGHIPPSSPSTK